MRTRSDSYSLLHPELEPRHPEIVAMGWKHIGGKLKAERTASILEIIKNMKEGNAVHRANALKFGLYNVLRQKGPAKSTLALLRCCDEKCPANKDPISHSNLRGRIVCPDRYHSQNLDASGLKCSECDHLREDHYIWCQGCRRVFQ